MSNKWNKNMIPVVVSLVLVAALGYGVVALGLKYDSNVSKLKKQNSQMQQQLSSAAGQQQQLESENAKLSEDNKQLQSKNSQLEQDKKKLQSENSSIKAMKQKQQGQGSSAGKPSTPAAKKGTPPADPNAARANSTEKVCYLTFDDGPSANTLEILKILKSENVKATFFVIAASKTEYIPQIAAEGHAVAIHSYTHDYAGIYKSVAAYYEDLNKMQAVIKAKTGKETKLMRFPGGSSNLVSKKYCNGIMTKLTHDVQSKGYRYFDWNVTSGDAESAKGTPAKTIVSNVLNGAKGKNQVCVLMHDAPAKKTTVEALPEIIKGLRERGYRFAALDETCYGFHHSALNN